jgi:hypothetical protein
VTGGVVTGGVVTGGVVTGGVVTGGVVTGGVVTGGVVTGGVVVVPPVVGGGVVVGVVGVAGGVDVGEEPVGTDPPDNKDEPGIMPDPHPVRATPPAIQIRDNPILRRDLFERIPLLIKLVLSFKANKEKFSKPCKRSNTDRRRATHVLHAGAWSKSHRQPYAPEALTEELSGWMNSSVQKKLTVQTIATLRREQKNRKSGALFLNLSS